MNEKREPLSSPEDSRKLWEGKGMILGSSHILMRESEYFEDKGQVSMAMIEESGVDSTKVVESCGPNCKFRLATITCPFFKEYPCLVGCTVRQHIRHGEGMETQDMDIFVTSQSGRFLIGEECVLELGNPNVAYMRLLRDKRGIPVVATKHKSLLESNDLGTGVDITDILREVKRG